MLLETHSFGRMHAFQEKRTRVCYYYHRCHNFSDVTLKCRKLLQSQSISCVNTQQKSFCFNFRYICPPNADFTAQRYFLAAKSRPGGNNDLSGLGGGGRSRGRCSRRQHSSLPHGLYSRTNCSSGERVFARKLHLTTEKMRACCGTQFTREYHKGTTKERMREKFRTFLLLLASFFAGLVSKPTNER